MLDFNKIKIGSKVVPKLGYIFSTLFVGRIGIISRINKHYPDITVDIYWKDNPQDHTCTEFWRLHQLCLLDEDEKKICRNKK